MTTPERFDRLRSVLARRQPDLTVLMERVHKPHNFSAVLRSSDAVGVLEAHVVPAGEFRAGHGTSGGASRWVPVVRHRSLEDAVGHLRRGGFHLVAAHPAPDAADFRAIDYTRPTALVLGTELEGLSDDAVRAADTVVRIPMVGAGSSLNVSVAAAVILYEVERQRAAAGMYDVCRLDADVFRTRLFEWTYPKVARLCRDRGVDYPELADDGEIVGEVPR